MSGDRTTRIRRRVNAPRAIVYRALLDARAVAKWMVPAGMTSHVHATLVEASAKTRGP